MGNRTVPKVLVLRLESVLMLRLSPKSDTCVWHRMPSALETILTVNWVGIDFYCSSLVRQHFLWKF